MSVSDILGRTPANILNGNVGANVKDLTTKFRTASIEMTSDSPFPSRAALQYSGLDRKYDALQSRLARGEIYNTNISVAKSNLGTKQLALNDIRAIITKFKGTPPTQGLEEIQTKADQANNALKEIAKVLNRKEEGRYIFGGKNDNTPPITGDITTLDETNFTNVVAVSNIVELSENMSVDMNVGTAQDIAPFIEALNLYKNGSDNATIEAALNKADENHRNLQVKVGELAKEVDAASIQNISEISKVKETLGSEFSVNVVDSTEKLKGSMQALLINFSISKGVSSLLDKLYS